jgi:glutathione S-transferase
MKLYSAGGSPNALRSRAVIYELGIPVEIVNLDFRKGEHKAPEFLKLNPNGKVPTFVDGDIVIWESRAINAYLATRFPGRNLYPADPVKRAHIDQWSYWQAVHLGPAMQKVNFERQKHQWGQGEADEAVVAAEMKNVSQFLGVLEQGLSDGRDWIVGDLSLADFAIASTFRPRARVGLSLDAYPKITAWIARLEALASWQRATAEMPPLKR